ncbi:MAG: cell envelope integrity protein TolA [Thermodesulfovibrionales bacterium]|jgi:colicin import membrane protein
MKPQGLRGGLTCSISLHLLLAVSVFFVVRFTQPEKLPVPYVVSLVDMPASAPEGRGAESLAPEEKEKEMPPPPAPESKAEARPKQTLPAEKQAKAKPLKPARKETDRGRIEDRIAAIEAKKRVERMASLRKMVSIGGQGSGQGKQGQGPAAKEGKDYYSQVMAGIRKQWIFPESLGKGLEAIVSIRVAADGKVTIIGMEKGSGNPLFDRSVLRAINLASPLPPPPREMEIGVRFRP